MKKYAIVISVVLAIYGLAAMSAISAWRMNPHTGKLDYYDDSAASYTVNGYLLSSSPSLTKGDVGLSSADNTSDAAKPVSAAMQTALDLKLNISSIPTGTGFLTVLNSTVSKVTSSANTILGFDSSGVPGAFSSYDYNYLLTSLGACSTNGAIGIYNVGATDTLYTCHSSTWTLATDNTGTATGGSSLVTSVISGATLTAGQFDGMHLFISAASSHTFPALAANQAVSIFVTGESVTIINPGGNTYVSLASGTTSTTFSLGYNAVLPSTGRWDFISTGTGTVYISGPSLALSSAPTTTTLWTGLVGKWYLANGTWTDTSGLGNNLSLVTGVTQTAGHGGTANAAAAFNGSGYLTIADASQTGLDLTGDMTIACWIKLSAASIGTAQILVSKLGAAGNESYNFIKNGSNQLSFQKTSNGTTLSTVASTGTVTTTTWHYLGMSYDQSNVNFYIDSALDSSPTLTGSIYNSTASFRIGSREFDTIKFTGAAQNCVVYSRSLSTADHSALYALGDGFF